MKTLTIIILSLLILTAHAQETKPPFDAHTWQAPYEFPTLKDWTTERFPIPISFAPEIKYEGVEDIHFAPGWAKVKSEEYWSYAFLWYLNGEVKMNSKIIANNLKAYYSGLISANAPNIPTDKMVSTKASFKEIKKAKGEPKS